MAWQVLDGIAPQWRDQVGDDVPVHAAAPWIAATSHRLTPRRLTFLATEAGQNGGLQAAVVDDQAADEMINLYRMLLAEPKVWKFPAASVAARAGLRDQVAPAEDWLPQLSVLYPGFDSFVAASGGPSAALAGVLVDGALSWAAGHGMKAVSFPYVRADTVVAQVLAERGFATIPLTSGWRPSASPNSSRPSPLVATKRTTPRPPVSNLAPSSAKSEASVATSRGSARGPPRFFFPSSLRAIPAICRWACSTVRVPEAMATSNMVSTSRASARRTRYSARSTYIWPSFQRTARECSKPRMLARSRSRVSGPRSSRRRSMQNFQSSLDGGCRSIFIAFARRGTTTLGNYAPNANSVEMHPILSRKSYK